MIAEIPLRRLVSILNGVVKYTSSAVQLEIGSGTHFRVSTMQDTDGYPFTEVKTLEFVPIDTQVRTDFRIDLSTLPKPLWTATVVYTQTSGDEYEYVRRCRKDNSTAYKSRPSGPEEEVRFKVGESYSLNIPRGAEEGVTSTLVALEGRLAELDRKTGTLRAWADSDLEMVALCLNWSCLGTHRVVPKVTLSHCAKQGVTLEQLREKLVCKKCGAKDPHVLPRVMTRS